MNKIPFITLRGYYKDDYSKYPKCHEINVDYIVSYSGTNANCDTEIRLKNGKIFIAKSISPNTVNRKIKYAF